MSEQLPTEKQREYNLPVSPGRPKGSPNKSVSILRDAIVRAATEAGGGDIVEYLKQRALDTPGPFLGLLGKVLPMQLADEGGKPLQIMIITGVPRLEDKTRTTPLQIEIKANEAA